MMDAKQLQAIEARCQRNQGRNDGMIRQDVMDLLAEVRRLRSKMCEKIERLQAENGKLRCCGTCYNWQPFAIKPQKCLDKRFGRIDHCANWEMMK